MTWVQAQVGCPYPGMTTEVTEATPGSRARPGTGLSLKM